MTVRFTSIQAYQELVDKGVDITQAEKALAAILKHARPVSRRQVAMTAGIETSALPSPVGKLIRAGVLAEFEPIKCPITGRQVVPVGLAVWRDQDPDQLGLAL